VVYLVRSNNPFLVVLQFLNIGWELEHYRKLTFIDQRLMKDKGKSMKEVGYSLHLLD
jgi:hypothetical protein